ncbi:diguanylate cyclase domain-containing protein [Streptomyces mirabilis]|uniref:diguanylate cyclase domain-containing protein n=1 Tax=Streptomyces mirabilis TaxID=68239 RepID=UPI003321E56A
MLHFKDVNDRLSHAAGDMVLRATADRLTAWAGPGAAVGRHGGDEFAIVLHLPRGRREVRLAQLMREDYDGVVAVAAQDLPGPGGVGVAPQEPGERILLRDGEPPVQREGVHGPAGQRHSGGGGPGPTFGCCPLSPPPRSLRAFP